MRSFFICLILLCFSQTARAHDTWVQTNTNLVRVGDLVHVDLMLGNHGNGHRDFKLASKISLEPCKLAIHSPSGKNYDLKPLLVDTGYAPKEGYWSARFTPGEAGLHMVAHTLDTLHLTTRAIKSGKTYFVAAEKLDSVSDKLPGFENPLGHPLEIVPQVNPVAPMGPGKPIRLQVLYQGKPLAGATVSFIGRGVPLAEEFDPRWERKTDEQGRASFTPTEGNYYLAVVHHLEPDQKGEGYERTHYSATLVVYVPQLCPCCNE